MNSAELILSGDEVQLRIANGEICPVTADELYSLKIEDSTLRGFDLVLESEDVKKISFSRYPLEAKIELYADDRGALRCAPIGQWQGSLQVIPDLLNRTVDHIVLRGTWVPIIRESLSSVRALVTELGLECPGSLTLRQYLALTTRPAIGDLIRNTVSFSASSPLQTSSSVSESIPKTCLIPLYPYQKTGFQWLTMISSEGIGCLLGDEMGLGKTAQIIALIAREKEAGASNPSLVLAPATILENWNREFVKFAPTVKVHVHRGRQRSGFPSELRQADVVVTSYETTVRDLPLFKLVDWNIVVLDEAQAIKNPRTRRTEAMKKLPRRVGIAVTGTPLENRLSDLWSLTDFAVPSYLGTLSEFQAHFEQSIDGAAQLEPRITPLMLRRKVNEVASDLPERIDIPQPLQLSTLGAQQYEVIRQEISDEYGKAATFVALTKLRMFCSHPSLIDEASCDPVEESPKYQRFLEILEEIFANGEKALVFTAFQKMIDLIIADVGDRTGAYVDFIDGRVPSHERQAKVDLFTCQAGAALLVLNPRTAGTGLNITAANHVIHYTLEWNPAVEDQASARAYRRGQTNPVTVHRLFYVDTVEEVMNDCITFKRDLAAAAILGTAGTEPPSDEIMRALLKSPLRASEE